MRNLEGRLQQWVQKGLIDQKQADNIQQFELTQGHRSWALYSVVGLGVVVLMTGVISILAANWLYIPSSTKLFLYFLAQAGMGFFFLRFANRPGLAREMFLSLNALLILAGIGLIGQVFNLGGDGWEAILLWVALVFPSLWLAQSQLIYHAWFAGYVGTIILWLVGHEDWVVHNSMLVALGVIGLAFAWCALGFGRALLGIPERFALAARQWSLGFLLLVLTPWANVAWSEKIDFYRVGMDQPISLGVMISLICAVAAGFAAWYSKPPLAHRLRLALIGLIATLWVFTCSPAILHPQDSPVTGCALFLIVWSFAAAAAAFAGKKRLFDLATFVIGARFVTVYFEVFGSLSETGIGLILSGGVILGTALCWHKYRTKLAAYLFATGRPEIPEGR